MDESNTVVVVSHVYKNFELPQERVSSLKGLFTGISKGSPWRIKETQHALRDINFEIKEGEFFGIVGRNGSGKSTLLKILAGIYQPTKGSTNITGKLVPFIELGVGFNMELTGRENIYLNGALLGFSKKEMQSQYEKIVEFAELSEFMDQKLKNYSSGMQVRLAFSLAIRANADVLLFDEVLAVGDDAFKRKCFNHFRELKKQKKTVILVSHDMNAIREYCDRALLIDKSKVLILDKANAVAKEYARLFIDDQRSDGESKERKKRMGVGKITYTKIDLNSKVISDQDSLEIRCEAKATEDIDEAIFGFLIKNGSDVNILGTNTQIERKKIKGILSGDTIKVEWKIPNIFSDGEYSIDPSIILYDGEVCDWWEDAIKFDVLKEDHAPYLVSPKFDLTISSPTHEEQK